MCWRLALVTCGPQLEVALQGPGWPCASTVRVVGGAPRSALLLAAVDLLVEEAGVERAALERVLVTRGPGSFTGIRAGLATAHGLAAAVGARPLAFSSLLVQAARCDGPGEVWAAQPGRRGEVYAQRFRLEPGAAPRPLAGIEVLPLAETVRRGPWAAPEALPLPGPRAPVARTAAEALLELDRLGMAAEPPEPLYVEGPPVHPGGRG